MKIEKSRFNSEAAPQSYVSQKKIPQAVKGDISVIPSIRKTGSYGVPFAFLNDHSKRKAAYIKKASKRGKDLQACKGEKSRLIAEEAELWRKYQPQLPEVH